MRALLLSCLPLVALAALTLPSSDKNSAVPEKKWHHTHYFFMGFGRRTYSDAMAWCAARHAHLATASSPAAMRLIHSLVMRKLGATDHLYLYEHNGFHGKVVDLTRSSNVPRYFNDKASSAKITGTSRWQVFQHSNYRGTSRILNPGSYSTPRAFPGNDMISSARKLGPVSGGAKVYYINGIVIDSRRRTFITYTNGKPLRYKKWCPREPNNHKRTGENCLEVISKGYGWCYNDVPCYYKRHFVCQR